MSAVAADRRRTRERSDRRKKYDYTRTAYTEMHANSVAQIVPKILDIHPARSVVDVGCNMGLWLKGFLDHGVERVVGIDGEHIDPETLVVDRSCIVVRELNKPLGHVGRFDLALSLETAEHLDVAHAETFVRDLCALADVVVFGAAVPFQGGAHHVNEQWQSFWVQLFADNGFDAYDVLRREIWALASVFWFYKQNTIVYAKRDSRAASELSRKYGGPTRSMFDLVHPELFRSAIHSWKNRGIVRKTYNNFRKSGGRPRGTVLGASLNGDDFLSPSAVASFPGKDRGSY